MPDDGRSGHGGIARTMAARDVANDGGIARTIPAKDEADRTTGMSAQLNEHAPAVLGTRGGEETLGRDPGQPTASTIASARKALPSIPGYEILGELGRGGMGIVYRARQTRLNRACALKMILAGEYASAEAGVRFLAEAETIARLRHPNVVQVYHVGDHEGRLYLELELADGGNLADRLDGTPWLPGPAAAMVEALAKGTAEAHRLGIVHRDLKPANVLLAADGTPKVADFGLAKSLAADGGLTRTESILGSPSYMAPEQAGGRAKEVGPAADVYSLGAILYELLTGRPPFKAATILETLELVKHAEPVPPARLVPKLPRDIETVTLKCLSKDPERRYASAAELAEDLRLFLANEPIRGRRAGLAERTWRRCRRNPAVASLSASVGLMAVALIVGTVVYALRQRELVAEKSALVADRSAFAEKKVLENQKTSADLYRALLGRAESARLARTPGYRRQVWKDLHEAAALDTPVKDPKAIVAQALACLGDPLGLDPLGLSETVANEAKKTPPSKMPPYQFKFSMKDGVLTFILADTEGRTLAERRLPAEVGGIRGFNFSGDHTKLFVACLDGLIVLSLPDLVPLAIWPGGQVNAIATDPADRLLASLNNTNELDLWNLVSHRLVATFHTPPGTTKLGFNAGGTILKAMDGSGKALLAWPIRDTPERLALLGHEGGVFILAFSPDGRHLATGSNDSTVKVWDTRTGALESTFTGHSGKVHGLAFSPNGAFLATSDLSLLLLRDFPSGAVRAQREVRGMWNLQFDPRGRYLVAKTGDRLVLWPLQPGSGPDPLGASVSTGVISQNFAMHPGGDDLLTISSSTSEILRVRLDAPGINPLKAIRALPTFQTLSFSPSGDRLFYAGAGPEIHIWDWAKQVNLASIPTGASSLQAVAASGDGRWIAAHIAGREMRIIDLTGGHEPLALPAESGSILCFGSSPDGTRLAVGLADGRVSLWNVEAIRDRLAEFGSVALKDVGRNTPRPAPQPGPALDFERIGRAWTELETLERRAIEDVRAGRWREAASKFARLAELTNAEHRLRYLSVIAAARGGDRETYQRLRRDLLRRAEFATTRGDREQAAKAGLLFLLEPGPDLDAAVRVAARATDGAPPNDPYLKYYENTLFPPDPGPSAGPPNDPYLKYYENTRALAEYRTGHDAAALEWSAKALAHGPPSPDLGVMAPCVRALAFRRLGRHNEARAELAKAIASARDAPSPDWYNLAADQILLAEATAAILDSDFPADPFTY